MGSQNKAVRPVILDTDIGTDIDDTWAVAMMLKCPELDVKLIASDTGNTEYRAKLIAKLLTVAGRTDIPVGVGRKQCDSTCAQEAWIEQYELSRYPGQVYANGVEAVIKTIMASPEPVTIICIGPVPNIAEALRQEPGIAGKAHFVGMHGHIRTEENDFDFAEYNVRQDIAACREVFSADWLSRTITPLNTCGAVRLEGDMYRSCLDSDDALMQSVVENYRIWCGAHEDHDADVASTFLYDTVAVHLAYSRDYLEMEPMKIIVTDEGYVRSDPAGSEIDVAIAWNDRDAFQNDLLERLIGKNG